ncbi:MAG: radical SAM protein [Acidobacteria bacterium]|nr:radical SAM protein [Acidobacteriota bacterium]MBU4306343.1 radical SAM protein [Acidobacteriota bacterium]MBU4405582.1 radical SAM protein [Acidobacteriota bacterium]MCG2810762.1 radical SAM protein [Candidatus Aminicenantes bacterium]
MTRFTCDWIFNILVVLCDGKVVCGCADPKGERPLGHLRETNLIAIWRSAKVRQIRHELNAGFSGFCLDCGLKKNLKDGEPVPQQPVNLEVLPRIFFEPTVVCNLNCFQAVCAPGAGLVATRERKFFPREEFQLLLEEIGAGLIRLDFFNYGEPFVHPQALDMIEHVKKKYPHIYLYTSSNGLLLDEKKITRLAESGIDEVTFSVDGADQRAYGRYRQGGDFGKLLKNMAALVREKRRLGREVPFINWRYILFKWNDSFWQMAKAKLLAKKIGVDRLTWEITDHPAGAASKKYRIDSPAWKRIFNQIWDSSQIGSALKGNRYSARIKVEKNRLAGPSGQKIVLNVAVKNRGGATWITQAFSGRRWVRLGAQLYDAEKRLLELNFARAFLPRPMTGGEKAIVRMELPAVSRSGDYWLKFDMVSEGADWFEKGGSPVLWMPLNISE